MLVSSPFFWKEMFGWLHFFSYEVYSYISYVLNFFMLKPSWCTAPFKFDVPSPDDVVSTGLQSSKKGLTGSSSSLPLPFFVHTHTRFFLHARAREHILIGFELNLLRGLVTISLKMNAYIIIFLIPAENFCDGTDRQIVIITFEFLHEVISNKVLQIVLIFAKISVLLLSNNNFLPLSYHFYTSIFFFLSNIKL